jgi:SSS family solute:Na+ symporter
VLASAWALIAGMKSVVWTDSLQSLIMMSVSILILIYIIYSHLGGFVEFFASISTQYPEFLTVPGPGFFSFKTFLGLSLPWFFFSISNPQVSQRLFIPRDLSAMKTMIKGFLGFGFIYTLISVIWGFSAKLLIPGLENADMATPQLLASEYVPTILALTAMIGITAAAISTIDSIMLTLSSLVVRDLFNKFEDQDNLKQLRQLKIAKIAIIIIALLGMLFAFQELDLIASLSVAASVGLMVVVPSMFGAFFWKGATAAGSLSSIIIGSFTAVYLQFSGWRPFGHSAGVWTLIVCVIVFITVSLFTEAPKEKADEFIDYLNQECEAKNII